MDRLELFTPAYFCLLAFLVSNLTLLLDPWWFGEQLYTAVRRLKLRLLLFTVVYRRIHQFFHRTDG